MDASAAHPALRPLLAGSDGGPIVDLAEARARRRGLAHERGGQLAPQERISDVETGDVRLRLYEPPQRTSRGVLVMVHGGGWVWGGLDEIDPLARAMAVATGRLTASVGYRLAPEHRFPAALDDVTAAVGWLADNAARYAADSADIVLVGLSAGGNLAAGASARSRDARRSVAAQVLCYPMLDPELATDSAVEFADAAPLTRRRAAWFWDQYAPGAVRQTPGASPLRQPNLAGLPPTHIVLAELDVLRDEGLEYAARLRAAGVPADAVTWPGTVHGFLTMAGLVPEICAEATTEIAAWITRSAARSGTATP
jgi:acetyl esterase/lipase